jgi:hypothetical protein
MLLAAFEPAITALKLLHTALDGTANGIGDKNSIFPNLIPFLGT